MKYLFIYLAFLIAISLSTSAEANTIPTGKPHTALPFKTIGEKYLRDNQAKLQQGDWDTAGELYKIGDLAERDGDKVTARKFELIAIESMDKNIALLEKNPANRNLAVTRLIQMMPYYFKTGRSQEARISLSKISKAYEDPINPYRVWWDILLNKAHADFLKNMSDWYMKLGNPQQSQKYKHYLADLIHKETKDIQTTKTQARTAVAWVTKLTPQEQEAFEPYFIKMMAERIRPHFSPTDIAKLPSNITDIVVLFTIKKDGTLENIKLLKTSTVKALDLDALAAMKAASPFEKLPDAINRESVNFSYGFSVHNPKYTEFRPY